MWAWVRIPPLTEFFFFLPILIFFQRSNYKYTIITDDIARFQYLIDSWNLVLHIPCILAHTTKQAKQEYQKVMIQLMEERQQHEAAVAEYKQVCATRNKNLWSLFSTQTF